MASNETLRGWISIVEIVDDESAQRDLIEQMTRNVLLELDPDGAMLGRFNAIRKRKVQRLIPTQIRRGRGDRNRDEIQY